MLPSVLCVISFNSCLKQMHVLKYIIRHIASVLKVCVMCVCIHALRCLKEVLILVIRLHALIIKNTIEHGV